ncbi:MAG: Gfo/Idh/MocA family oxidoreductase, partial [Candidatus Poribacteria bacterium]
MPKTYRLGVVGFAHMHVTWLTDYFSALDNVEWVACADTVPLTPSLSDAHMTRAANVKHARETNCVPKAYDDYREMLDSEEFDIIIACPENARHGEVIEAIAEAGSHIVTEKPPSASSADFMRGVRAADLAGVELIVNWPSTWSAATRLVKEIVDSGEIGQVFQVKWRQGSMGPLPNLSKKERGAEWWHQAAPGGGALLDYCCYGANISRWIIGESPEAVIGMTGNFASQYGDAEDNAALLVRYPSAMTILESTWSCVNHGVSSRHVVYGTDGTIAVESGGVRVFKDGGEGEARQAGELPGGRDTVAKEVIHHFETGEDLHPTLTVLINIDAMAILDAGIRSAASGKLEQCHSA